jgi:hypothetical protein
LLGEKPPDQLLEQQHHAKHTQWTCKKTTTTTTKKEMHTRPASVATYIHDGTRTDADPLMKVVNQQRRRRDALARETHDHCRMPTTIKCLSKR